MTPYFDKAIRYFVQVTCLSPLRTGGTDRDNQQILRDCNGIPFLQGASLAGALNGWKQDEVLFGSHNAESELIVSDLVFSGSSPIVRPRLRIDGESGTSAKGAKFETAALPTQTKGSFQLTWRGTGDPERKAADIEAYLGALHYGEITLGAQKNNGFGRVALTVKKREYDLMKTADLQMWLDGDNVTDAREIALPIPESQMAVFRVEASVPDLLIKASGEQGAGKGKLNAVQIRENGEIVIPGSSLKGVIRAQIQRTSPFFHHSASVDELFGRASAEGDNGVSGKIRFSDGCLQQAKTAAGNRIRIDRFTGGVMGRGLFREESVAGKLRFEIRIPVSMKTGCAQVMFALRDFGLGLFELGSGSSIGRGRADRLRVEVTCGGSSACLSCEGGRVSVRDDEKLLAHWQEALSGRDGR